MDQTRVCLVISQDFFFVSIWSFLYLPYSTDSTVDQNTLTYGSDIVCQKTILTTYFDKLWFCKFVFICVQFFICLWNRTAIFSFCLIFVPKKHYITLRLEKRMFNPADQINLDKIVFDENNSERRSWSCIGHFCSRSLLVFLSQIFVISLVILGSFWRIHLSKSCDESTVWVEILCSAAGFIVPTPRLWKNLFLLKIEFSSL